MLRRAATLEAFREDLVGSYTAGTTWVHAAVRPELFVVLLFDAPNEEDMRQLVESLRLELDEGVAPHRSLVDAGGVARADLGAFETLGAYVGANRDRLSEQVTALSLVRPKGMEGAVVAGFFEVLGAPYPVSVFEDTEAALSWLGEDDPKALVEALEALTSASPTAGALRAFLTSNLDTPELDAAARALGVSSRTLQRRLETEGTTFQQEVLRARLAEAERRMLQSDAPLTTIALDAGFGTLQRFSTAFKRVHGLSASEWRAKKR